jgi:CspA family cold shock protein
MNNCRGVFHNTPESGKILQMKKGTVKFFNSIKGFGFIKGEDGQDVFVHVTGLKEDIQENDNVSYDTEVGKRGVNAINVRLQH